VWYLRKNLHKCAVILSEVWPFSGQMESKACPELAEGDLRLGLLIYVTNF
jgi:hypothetical protein